MMGIKYTFDNNNGALVHLYFVAQEPSGSVAIFATNGVETAVLGYLTTEGTLMRSLIHGDELRALGFRVDRDGKLLVE